MLRKNRNIKASFFRNDFALKREITFSDLGEMTVFYFYLRFDTSLYPTLAEHGRVFRRSVFLQSRPLPRSIAGIPVSTNRIKKENAAKKRTAKRGSGATIENIKNSTTRLNNATTSTWQQFLACRIISDMLQLVVES